MNERIRKLAQQAGIKITPMILDGVEYEYEDVDMDGSEDLEKFAELIVGECMRMCDVAAIGYESHGHMKEANGCYSAKEYIEDHFGVE